MFRTSGILFALMELLEESVSVLSTGRVETGDVLFSNSRIKLSFLTE